MNIDAWLSQAPGAIDTARRAALAWKRIQRSPASIAFKTPSGTTLAAQTVRLEASESVTSSQSPSGDAAVRQVTVFGVRGHDTVADTTIKQGYRFVLAGSEYRVVDVVLVPGEVQARAEAVS